MNDEYDVIGHQDADVIARQHMKTNVTNVTEMLTEGCSVTRHQSNDVLFDKDEMEFDDISDRNEPESQIGPVLTWHRHEDNGNTSQMSNDTEDNLHMSIDTVKERQRKEGDHSGNNIDNDTRKMHVTVKSQKCDVELTPAGLAKFIRENFPDVGDLSQHPITDAMAALEVTEKEVQWIDPPDRGVRTQYSVDNVAD